MPASPKNEPVSRMVARHIWALCFGIFILGILGSIAVNLLPSARFAIRVAVVVLIGIWFIVGFVAFASEWITKRSESDDEAKII